MAPPVGSPETTTAPDVVADGTTDDAPVPDPGPLARRLQYLLDNVRHADGKRYTYREVIAGIEARGGPSISIGYLSQLVTGARTNPMMDAIQGLAAFFGVPISYFDASEDSDEANQNLRLLAALQDPGVQKVALHSVGLPLETKRILLTVIDHMRTVNGLPPAE